MASKILRLPEVIEKTGFSRGTIYLRIATESFPAAISLGGRAVGWVESELDDWIVVQIKNSRASARQGGAI